ncbi:MAG: hypothetical protein Q8O35_12890, partial [Humidesulfovibrio sp.]|nr:hypothetical protein [Humidesulfovibrio sp.]
MQEETETPAPTGRSKMTERLKRELTLVLLLMLLGYVVMDLRTQADVLSSTLSTRMLPALAVSAACLVLNQLLMA